MSAPLARLERGERLSRAEWRQLLEKKDAIDRQALFRREYGFTPSRLPAEPRYTPRGSAGAAWCG